MSSEKASTRRPYRSGWALFWGFLWRFTLAAGVASGVCAAMLSSRLAAYDRHESQERAARTEVVSDELRAALRGFSADVERLRGKASALRATQSVRGTLGDGVLHWAELYADDAHVLGVRRTLPGTAALSPTLEAVYLQAAVTRLGTELAAIRKDRLGLLRVEDATASHRERLVFVFPLPAPENNLLLAMVDPEQALPSLLASKREPAGLRKFLVDRDGRVLAHSERNYIGSDFSLSDSYQKLLARAHGAEPVVLSRVKASDALEVTAAGAHPLGLPLLIGFEKPLPLEADATWLGLSPREQITAFWVLSGLASLFACAVGTILWLWLVPALRRRTRAIEVDEVAPATAAPSAPPAQVPAPLARPPSAGEYPHAFETALVESAFRQGLASDGEAWPNFEEASLAPAQAQPQEPAQPQTQAPAQSQFDADSAAETAPSGPSAEQLASLAEFERREREFIEGSLMDRYEDALIHERDPRKIAYLLTEFAQRLCEAPAAFFGFHSGLRSAILLHACALPPQSKRLVSFPLSDAVLSEVMRADREGRIASLDGYLPIRDLLKLVYRVADFRAWALTGVARPGQTAPSILGVLVVFRAAEAPKQLIEQAIRSTGPLYEKNLHQQQNA